MAATLPDLNLSAVPVKDQLIDQLASQIEVEALASRRLLQPRVNLSLVNTIHVRDSKKRSRPTGSALVPVRNFTYTHDHHQQNLAG